MVLKVIPAGFCIEFLTSKLDVVQQLKKDMECRKIFHHVINDLLLRYI